MNHRSKPFFAMLLVLLLVLSACGGDEITTYPDGPITIIVPFDPGGQSDVEARRLQPHLEEILGQTVNVQYRTGGGGVVGWSFVAEAEPDGYTVAGALIPDLLAAPMLRDDAGYEIDDFRYVAWNARAPMALIVRDDHEFGDLEGFIGAAAQRPGALTVAGSGELSTGDLTLAQLVRDTGIDVSYVPVDGGAGPVILQLLGGHVDAAIISVSHAARSEEELAVLAVTETDRASAFPDVPTFSEFGYDLTMPLIWGVAMPIDTPEDIVQAFASAVLEAMEREEVVAGIREGGLDPLTIGPDEASAVVVAQQELMSELIALVEQGLLD